MPQPNEHLAAIRQYLKHGTYPANLTKNKRRTVRSAVVKGQYELDGGRLFYNTHVRLQDNLINKRLLVVTDEEEKMRLIRHCHSADSSAHVGVNATQDKLAMTHYWRGMKEDVRRFYESCETCQHQIKLKKTASNLKPIKVLRPWHMVGMDIVGPLRTTPQGNKYILSLTDYFTKFVDFYALPTKGVEAVAKVLETFFFRYGAPERLLLDQGREFVNKINDAVAKKFRVKLMATSASLLQANGLEERTKQTLKDQLGQLCNDQQDDWDQYLEEVAFSMRTSKQEATNYSPFFLMFRREARMPYDMDMAPEEDSHAVDEPVIENQLEEQDVDEFVAQTEEDIQDVNQKVLDNIDISHKKQKELARSTLKGVRVSDLKKGQEILKSNMKHLAEKGEQFEHRWLVPKISYQEKKTLTSEEESFTKHDNPTTSQVRVLDNLWDSDSPPRDCAMKQEPVSLEDPLLHDRDPLSLMEDSLSHEEDPTSLNPPPLDSSDISSEQLICTPEVSFTTPLRSPVTLPATSTTGSVPPPQIMALSAPLSTGTQTDAQPRAPEDVSCVHHSKPQPRHQPSKRLRCDEISVPERCYEEATSLKYKEHELEMEIKRREQECIAMEKELKKANKEIVKMDYEVKEMQLKVLNTSLRNKEIQNQTSENNLKNSKKAAHVLEVWEDTAVTVRAAANGVLEYLKHLKS